MMTQRLLTMLLGIGLFGVFAASNASAQSELLPEDATPIQRQFVDELGTTLVDYWNPRFNAYKRTIDRMLSPSDLQELNELRVRWSILMDGAKEKMAQKANADDDVDIEMAFTDDDGTTFMELFDIWSKTLELAQGYRSGLDNLSEDVIEDAGSFSDEVVRFVNRFSDDNHSELAKDEKGSELLSSKEKMTEGIGELKNTLKENHDDVMQVYGMIIEPIIMLFNGGDMRDMLPLNMGNVSGVDASAVAGLLPQSAVLSQNVPNPASSVTTINFALAEPSSATTLRVYSSDGELVKSADLGALSAGSGSHNLDVSGFANGSYLYHLTVMTSGGEMVYSKVMQVVR